MTVKVSCGKGWYRDLVGGHCHVNENAAMFSTTVDAKMATAVLDTAVGT
jgi:hypothetical protein